MMLVDSKRGYSELRGTRVVDSTSLLAQVSNTRQCSRIGQKRGRSRGKSSLVKEKMSLVSGKGTNDGS